MVLLRANEELKQTFDRMIAAMKAPVAWSGIFAVIDDYIILQGEVRSLFFHFDTKKVTTNIIDIPVEEQQVAQVADNICLQNTINMILYVFGKWGSIEGIKVNKDLAELNRLFTGILHELGIEPDYTWDHFRFYQGGIRITYEDVVSQALVRERDPLTGDGSPAGGLWRKIVWKRRQIRIARDDAGRNGSQDDALPGASRGSYALRGGALPGASRGSHASRDEAFSGAPDVSGQKTSQGGRAGRDGGTARDESGGTGVGRAERLGHNFYVTSYLCPVCGGRLHMVVYPEGRETRIETDEGGVLLARACTCSRCQSFCTPRPGRLIGEGDVYVMEFADDTPAYEDYLGLLGRKGQKTSNYNYNEFADPKKREEQRKERESESLEELCGNLPELPQEELEKVVARMEEGFYPEESVETYGERIREQCRRAERAGLTAEEEQPGSGDRELSSGEERSGSVAGGDPAGEEQSRSKDRDSSSGEERSGSVAEGRPAGAEGAAAGARDSRPGEVGQSRSGDRESSFGEERSGSVAEGRPAGAEGAAAGARDSRPGEAGQGRETLAGESDIGRNIKNRSDREGNTGQNAQNRSDREHDTDRNAQSGAGPARKASDAGGGLADGGFRAAETAGQQHARQKYEARMQMLDRYSDRQLRELKSQLEHETQLLPEDRDSFLARVSQRLTAGLLASLTKKVDACAGKNYAVMKRVRDEIREAPIEPAQTEPLLSRLTEMMQRQASEEVGQMVLKIPPDLDRARYRTYLERIRSYEGVDLTPYEEQLNKSREAAERQELANLVRRSRKISREDLTGLIQKLESGDFLPELVSPYVEKTKEKIRQIDAARIEELCPDLLKMTFDEAMEAYERIKEEDFLPELKEDTLRSLRKRLSKLKSDECELLVQKLQAEFASAGIHENPRHHFYPARKVMLKQASEQETAIFEYAMACYAADRGLFEYPILVVDTARGQSGKEGIILTPDHLFYSTMLNAYGIPVASIASIRASSGLLNKGVTVLQKNGTKTKIPYAVDAKELTAYAEVLNDFVHYLQEKPDSRKVTYLAKEHHDQICCFRCGFEYKGGSICPKCGYQNNG